MRKSKDLLNFLFGESQSQQDLDGIGDDIAGVFEKMDEIESMEVNQKPLEAALKDVGIDYGEVRQDDSSKCLCLYLDNELDFNKAVASFMNYENMHKFASNGWLALRVGEESWTNDTKPTWKIAFVPLQDGRMPEKNDDQVDLEALLKAAQEFAVTPTEERSNLIDPPKGGIVKPLDKAADGAAAKTEIKDDMVTAEMLAKEYLMDEDAIGKPGQGKHPTHSLPSHGAPGKLSAPQPKKGSVPKGGDLKGDAIGKPSHGADPKHSMKSAPGEKGKMGAPQPKKGSVPKGGDLKGDAIGKPKSGNESLSAVEKEAMDYINDCNNESPYSDMSEEKLVKLYKELYNGKHDPSADQDAANWQTARDVKKELDRRGVQLPK